jgi:uncharacterized protein (DUF1330 family)
MLATVTTTPSAQTYEENITALTEHVMANPMTQNGYWLEMKNVFGDWEKLLLIFGFDDPGDEAQCSRLVQLVSADSPQREFRCNSVK